MAKTQKIIGKRNMLFPRNHSNFDSGIQGCSKLLTKIIEDIRGKWNEESGHRNQAEDQISEGDERKGTIINILVTEGRASAGELLKQAIL